MSTDFELAVRTLLKPLLREVLAEVSVTRSALNRVDAEAKPPQLLMSPADAAEALSISTRTLWSLTQTKELPCVRIGRLVRYDVAALQDWIRGQGGGASSAIGTEQTRKRQNCNLPRGAKVARPKRRVPREAAPTQAEPARRVRKAPVQRSAADELSGRTRWEQFMDQLGVDVKRFPGLTNGDLMRIAQVDTATLHGWKYLGPELPEPAMEKLRAYFTDPKNWVPAPG